MEFKISNLTLEENAILHSKTNEIKNKVDEKTFNKLIEVFNLLDKFNLSINVYLSEIALFCIENGLILMDDYEFENEEVKNLTEKVFGLDSFDFNSYQDEAENIYKVFLSMVKNVTVVILVLTKMLVRLRHLEDQSSEKQKLLCTFAREIYAPLAARLGFADIKGEMEDICLKYFNPSAYFDLKKTLDENWSEVFEILLKIKNELAKMLEELGIKGQIFSRQKHISSIYYKMQSKQISVSEVYDFAALRVVVETEEECYSLLGKIHSLYRPMPGRIKDYISNPKPNGYQSLHTTIIYDNKPVEIQIRTRRMHEQNEIGVSAHFLYKEKGDKIKSIDKSLLWARKLLAENKNSSAIDFVESLKMDLVPGKIFVQTPQGKIVELPEGACALDFAYAIHSGIGNSCCGAKVNGQFVSISSILKNNDVVEIITSPTVKGPSLDWLKFVKTPSAKKKINDYFKSKLKEDNIKNGKLMLEKYLQAKKLNLKDILPEVTEDFLYKKFSVKDINTLFAGVGYGSFKCEICGNRFEAMYLKNHPELLENSTAVKKKKSNGSNLVVIAGDKNYFYKFASCCKPIKGDKIVAVITRGRGVSIHKADCPNLKGIPAERLLEAHFEGSDAYGEMDLKIGFIDNPFVIPKISLVFSGLGIPINKLEINRTGESFAVVSINVKTSEIFEKIEKKLSNLKFVTYVKRI